MSCQCFLGVWRVDSTLRLRRCVCVTALWNAREPCHLGVVYAAQSARTSSQLPLFSFPKWRPAIARKISRDCSTTARLLQRLALVCGFPVSKTIQHTAASPLGLMTQWSRPAWRPCLPRT
ncbi:uncharacterized protein [Dermacentor albipictus]|uniref:uncharacterized protein isoform X2 n=1 Tax=Dermacentor albipictus TaxID=60249 RepID=UPI0038FC448F